MTTTADLAHSRLSLDPFHIHWYSSSIFICILRLLVTSWSSVRPRPANTATLLHPLFICRLVHARLIGMKGQEKYWRERKVRAKNVWSLRLDAALVQALSCPLLWNLLTLQIFLNYSYVRHLYPLCSTFVSSVFSVILFFSFPFPVFIFGGLFLH